MSKIYIVAGDNGMGNSGHCVFGLYPTEELAKNRVAVLEEEGAAEYVYYDSFEYSEQGSDFQFHVEG